MIVLGHRGVRAPGAPRENSLAAFAQALADGAAGVELDVRVCATGEPVLVHDPLLPDRRFVDRVAKRELPADVPTLDEALEACRGKIVNVELKGDVPNRPALAGAAARAIKRARGVEVIVSSFDPLLVGLSATLLPRVRRGILVGARTPRLATALPLAMRALVSGAHLEDRLATPGRIARLSRAGLRVVVWTVNDPARAVELRKLGAHVLITDRPREILSALD